MENEDLLILVDENDSPCGTLGKLEVHQQGLLHRAFSVFIFNTRGELLLQQRAEGKYHSGGLWTNTCCSHPRFGEDLNLAVERRLQEEMGMKCNTEFVFSFRYRAQFENGLTEHEYDHVFFGISDDLPHPDASEVQNWRYIDLNSLERDLREHPQKYTAWLQLCFEKALVHYRQFFPK